MAPSGPTAGSGEERPPIPARDDTDPIPIIPPPPRDRAGAGDRGLRDPRPGGAPVWGPTERGAAGGTTADGGAAAGRTTDGAAAEGEAGGGSAGPPAGSGATAWGTAVGEPPRRASAGFGGSTALLVGSAVLAVLLLALLGANALVARNAEDRAAEEASAALGSPAHVRFARFPVGLRLLVGAPVDATLLATDVPLDGTAAALTRLEVAADDVVVDRRGDGAIRADNATFVAELDDEAVQQMVGIIGRIPLTDVELANGVARLSVAGFTLLDATAEVEGGQVVFRVTAPIGNLADVRLELDDLPLGFRADAVEIRPGVLRLRGSATDVRLGDPP